MVTNKCDYPKYDWNTDLYKMFFELGVKSLTNSSGVLCFITPKFFMVNKEDEKMREYFIDNMHILFLATCNPFEVVTENVISLMKQSKSIQKEITLYKYNTDTKTFDKYIPIDVNYSRMNLYKEWIMGIDSQVLSILTKMNTQLRLKDISISKRGAEVSKKYLRNTERGLPSLIGQDVRKYVINWSNTYLDESHSEYNRLQSFFAKDMIYLRRVDVCLEAAISDVAYGFNKNVYGIKIDCSKGFESKFVLALINSRALDYYYKKKFSTKKEDVFPEIQTYLYEQLPIPSAIPAQQQPIIDLVDTILAKKQQDPQADTTAEEQQIDLLVYRLYDLTYDEILIIDPATPITKHQYEHQ